MPSDRKSVQLQIRVTPAEKTAIQRAARRAGLDMSGYVLACALPAPSGRFETLAAACKHPDETRRALAELNTWLAGLGARELPNAVASPPPAGLSAYLANYIAAMVELACARRGVAPPAWTRRIEPLREPVFGSSLAGLRLHLLTHSPPPFRRRNIFIDSSIGSRV